MATSAFGFWCICGKQVPEGKVIVAIFFKGVSLNAQTGDRKKFETEINATRQSLTGYLYCSTKCRETELEYRRERDCSLVHTSDCQSENRFTIPAFSTELINLPNELSSCSDLSPGCTGDKRTVSLARADQFVSNKQPRRQSTSTALSFGSLETSRRNSIESEIASEQQGQVSADLPISPSSTVHPETAVSRVNSYFHARSVHRCRFALKETRSQCNSASGTHSKWRITESDRAIVNCHGFLKFRNRRNQACRMDALLGYNL